MSRLVSYPVDLHMHSRFSDGLHTPEALARMARKLCLRAVALCDHDTVSGIDAMADAASAGEDGQQLDFIPAVELSCGADSNTHILGYGVDSRNARLLAEMDAARNRRQKRMETMIQRMTDLGAVFPEEALRRLLTPGTGRAHMARELIALGMVNTMQQAFDRYLGPGKPGYVSMERLSAADGIRLLREAGALPVLAHPMRLRLPDETRIALMEELAQAGLAGVEAWHPSADGRQAMQLDRWARRKGLLVTGGSDFHGDPNTSVSMGRMPSGWKTWQEDLQALQEACAKP